MDRKFSPSYIKITKRQLAQADARASWGTNRIIHSLVVLLCIILSTYSLLSQNCFEIQHCFDTVEFEQVGYSKHTVDVFLYKCQSERNIYFQIKFPKLFSKRQNADLFILRNDSLFIAQTCYKEDSVAMFLDVFNSNIFTPKTLCNYSLLGNAFYGKSICFDSSFLCKSIKYKITIEPSVSYSVFVCALAFSENLDLLEFTLYDGEKKIEFKRSKLLKNSK